ncbi:MAG: hypothetical protein ATN31_09970 [Candidatus Epulonipiscioides saccharophilum]|nr:MAG: hypothetical protein ATN31_09970 [Epulopiscium sp. AS2M-Bin001]
MKALIKHECNNLSMFFVTFIVLGCLTGLKALQRMQDFQVNYLDGILDEPEFQRHFGNLLREMQFIIIIPIIIMVYFQFKEVKDANVSDFILSLPFTAKKIIISKMLIGISILILNGVVIGLFFVGINIHSAPMLEHVRAISPVGKIFEGYTDFSMLAMTIKYILDMIFIYLVFVVGQFLVKKLGAGIVLTCMGMIAVPYLGVPLVYMAGLFGVIDRLTNIFFLGDMSTVMSIQNSQGELLRARMYDYNVGINDLLITGLCVLTVMLILYLVNKVGFTRFMYFTCSKTIDKILIIATGICSSVLPFYYYYWGGRGFIVALLLPVGLILGIIGMLIMSRIIQKDLDTEK